jgi:adenylate kinase
MVLERTLALIKPDACARPWMDELVAKAVPAEDAPEDAPAPKEKWVPAPELRSRDKAVDIIARIRKEGFTIVEEKMMRLSKKEAEAFYGEHAGRPFFDTLTSFMSSGPIIALVLEKENAIKEWRNLMGPTNSTKAKEAAEAANPLNEECWSVRALFGTDGTRNATHGSDSPFSAWRETGFFFPVPTTFERTVAVVLPHLASQAGKADAVVARLEDSNFFVVARKSVTLSAEQAASVLGEGASAEAVAAVTEGACELVAVEKVAAVSSLRLAAGPPTAVAKASGAPSLHGAFGVDDAKCGVLAPLSHEVAAALFASAWPAPLPVERTLCVIKPGTAETSYRAIAAEVLAAGFSIVAETRRTLSREEVEIFYGEHAGRPFFDGLCTYMSSGPVVALCLAKPNGIRNWRQMQGPTATSVARREKPSSLRARFGVDGTRNATHGSDSVASATRELRFYFPALVPDSIPTGEAAAKYVRETRVAEKYDAGKGFTVPVTLEGVIVEGLAELARAKPTSDPAEAIRWLGEWMIENNPRRGRVAAAPDGPHVHSRVRVVEPEDDGESKGGESKWESKWDEPAAAAAPKAPRTIVFVLGAPGSGKGTQCERIAKTFGYAHLSTGDLLRDEVKSGSALGKELEGIMAVGALVPTALVLKMVSNAMDTSGKSKFLIDGFPRALDQAKDFETTVGLPTFVLSFDASETVLEERLVNRGKTSGRADDNVESIRKRFATFKSQSEPVIDFYAKLGLVRKLNSERSVDSVWADVQPLFKPQCVWVVGGPGVGRSTQCKRLAGASTGFNYLSTGDLIRAEVSKGTSLGVELGEAVKRGDDVSMAITMQLLSAAIEASEPLGRYVLDGFPRNMEQALAFEATYGPPLFMLQLTAPDAVLVARATTRSKSAGGPARSDEHKSVVKKLLETYKRETLPVVDLYSKMALVRTVDAERAVDFVFDEVRAHFAPTIVFVLGGPGSGKGTQCANIVRDFGYTHLSAGDLLRAEVERGSPSGALINSYIVEGKIVPLAITLGLLKSAMAAAKSMKFLVDGFPRAMDQALDFEKTVGACSFVLFFDCPEETMRSRLLERGKTSGRADDNASSIVKRFHTFVEQSMPVINHYAKLGKVRQIDATPSATTVFNAVRDVFAPTVVYVLGLPGSGKGTQCANIVRDFGYTHLSTGDLLRAEVTRGSAMGLELESTMASGALVPDAAILSLLTRAMTASNGRRFLVDGFPRAMDQALALEGVLGRKPSFVLHFDVPKDVVKARLLARGKATGRADDTEAAIDKRFAVFDTQSSPVIRHYAKSHLVRVISGLQKPADVYDAVRPLFQPRLVLLIGCPGSGREELAMRAGRELSYATLAMSKLLENEVRSGSAAGKEAASFMAAHSPVPTDLALDILSRAMARTTAVNFLIDGFPRTVTAGFPGAHDQVFALEARIGAVKGAIFLDASPAKRIERVGAKTAGELAALADRLDTFRREKMPVLDFMRKVGKAAVIDTSKREPDEVFELARPFLE